MLAYGTASDVSDILESTSTGYPYSDVPDNEALGHPIRRYYQAMRNLWQYGSGVRGLSFALAAQDVHYSGSTGQEWPLERESLKQEVGELLTDAGIENWDGEDALALSPETVAIAKSLIDWFPPYIESPDVSATPHGEVDFDWVIDRDAMLTVSVGPSNEIAFAGLFHGTRLNGSEPWKGGLPHFVNCCFERLRDAQSR